MATIWSWHRGTPITLSNKNNDLEIKTSNDFFHAAINGDIEYIEKYIDNGGNVDERNIDGWTALMLVSYNHEALMQSLKSRNNGVIETLIQSNANVNLKNKKGETALILAVSVKHTIISPELKRSQIRTVKSLLNANADVNIIDNKGWTALNWAKYNNLITIVEILKDYGAK